MADEKKPVETQTAEPTNAQEPVKTNREIWQEALRKKNPDMDFSNEDDFYKASMAGYDTEHEAVKKMKADNDALSAKLTENPDVAMFFASLLGGESMWKSLSFLDEIKPRQEGDEGWEEYNAGVADRKAKAEAAEKAMQEYTANMEKSKQALKEFADETGMSEQEAVDFVKGIQTMIADKLFSGNVDKEFFSKMYKLQNYDSAIADAQKAGEIEGKNAKIDETRRKQTKTDGLPAINAGGGTQAPAQEEVENPTLARLKQMSADHERRTRML